MRFKKEDKEKERVLSSIISHIAEGTVIEGTIDCEQELLISGTVKGNIRCGKKLIIAQNGRVLGNVCFQAVTIMGNIEVDFNSDGLLVLESQSIVLSQITSLLIEAYARTKIESQVCTNKDIIEEQTPPSLAKIERKQFSISQSKEFEAVH